MLNISYSLTQSLCKMKVKSLILAFRLSLSCIYEIYLSHFYTVSTFYYIFMAKDQQYVLLYI